MTFSQPKFLTRLAETKADHDAAHRLRYDVFVSEMGADGPMVDHDACREADRFDAFSSHLLLIDAARPTDDQVVGVYRFMDRAGAQAAGGFYSEDEFDVTPLLRSGQGLLELGRTCLHKDYRGGAAMMHMWSALAKIAQDRGASLLFGTASFHGTDSASLAAPLGVLMRDHLIRSDLRPVSRQQVALPPLNTDLDKIAAMRQVPALIKAYLRLGGGIGEGVFVDHAFNTTDVCLVLDTNTMSDRQRALYGAPRP